jgi:hypothetical protein
LANEGLGGAHFDGPGYCGRVVTPYRSLEVEHGDELFEEEVLEEEASHFQVVDGQLLRSDPCDYIGGPLGSPDNWFDVLEAGEPDAAGTVLAGIAVPQVGGVPRDELLAVDRCVPEEFEEGAEV